MKIAFFVNTFPALSQTFILSQIISLTNKNHEVDIFARKEGIKKGADPTKHCLNSNYKVVFYGRPYFGLKKNRMFKYVDFSLNIIGAAIHNPLMLARLIIKTRFGKSINCFNTFNNVISLLHGKKLFYDIIQCHFGQNGNIAAILKDIGFIKGKIITTFHGYDMTSYIKRKGDDVYAMLFKVGDMFLPVSENWENALIALGCSAEKIRVHRMGVELDRINRGQRRRDRETVNLLSVARLVEKKGIEYGIESVSKVLKKHPDLKYRIVGDGPLRKFLGNLINELGIAAKVELLGWKSQEEVFAMLNDTDIFIAPSVSDEKGDQEGIPVVLMEAMAYALPVLSTRHSGIPELVKDGAHGFLVPERDVDALTEKLAYLVANPEIRLKMGESGRNFVVKNHDNRKLNENLFTIYKDLCQAGLTDDKDVEYAQ